MAEDPDGIKILMNSIGQAGKRKWKIENREDTTSGS
jgi:hypothetical protein